MTSDRLKTVCAGVFLHRHGRAKQVWIYLGYSAILDGPGRRASLLAIVIETTDRVAAVRALRSECDRSRGVLDNMVGAFTLLDRDFRIIDVNAAVRRLERRPVRGGGWEGYAGKRTGTGMDR